jgi:hypothetical protein
MIVLPQPCLAASGWRRFLNPAAAILSGMALAFTGASARTSLRPTQGRCLKAPAVLFSFTASCMGCVMMLAHDALAEIGRLSLFVQVRANRWLCTSLARI